MTIPTATIPIKTVINCHLSTFFRIITSGSESPTTDIIKASEVPNDAPFSIKTETIGIIPAALEYNGIPINTERGTLYHADFPMSDAI